MYIYIDESGPFATVPSSRAHRISAVTALAIPEGQHDQLITAFEELELSWGGDSDASVPTHLKPYARGHGGLNMGLVLSEHFALGESALTPGLRLVDILASAFTRALNDTLGRTGWRGLGGLIVGRNNETIKFTRLKVNGMPWSLDVAPYATVVRELTAEAKSMFPHTRRSASLVDL